MTHQTYKFSILGVPGVGKTSIARRASLNTFNEDYLSTVGLDIYEKELEFNLNTVTHCKIMLWDIQGEERWTPVLPSYVEGSDAILFVTEHASQSAFDGLKNLYSKLKDSIPKHCNVLINKEDLYQDEHLTASIHEWSLANTFNVFSTSAKSDSGITPALKDLLTKLNQ